MTKTKPKKPIFYKPRGFPKLVAYVVFAVLIICVIVCVVDGVGLYNINNIEKFWEVFIMLIMFFVGYLTGTNITK